MLPTVSTDDVVRIGATGGPNYLDKPSSVEERREPLSRTDLGVEPHHGVAVQDSSKALSTSAYPGREGVRTVVFSPSSFRCFVTWWACSSTPPMARLELHGYEQSAGHGDESPR